MMEDIGAFGAKRVLDIGCGRGRVAMHTATVTKAHVSGINIDPSQIANAQHYAPRLGLAETTDFQVSSLNDRLPFDDETFDAAYEIQAFTYCKDKVAVMKEVFRVLKPGAKFSYLDWVLLDNYDPENEVHVDHVKVRTLLQNNGFDLFYLYQHFNTYSILIMYIAHHALYWSRR